MGRRMSDANLLNLDNPFDEIRMNSFAFAGDFDVSERALTIELREVFMALDFVALNQRC